MALRHFPGLDLSVLLAFFAFNTTTYSQILYGSITGNVLDPTGAAVPGATVLVENPTTGLQRQTTTNNDGIYLAGDLPPGTYNVTVRARRLRRLL